MPAEGATLVARPGRHVGGALVPRWWRPVARAAGVAAMATKTAVAVTAISEGCIFDCAGCIVDAKIVDAKLP